MFEKLTFISCDSDPLSITEIEQVLATTGPLPDDYKYFLLSSNGGRLGSDNALIAPIDLPKSVDYETSPVGVSHFAIVDPQFPPLIVKGKFGGRKIRMIEVAGEYRMPIFLMSLDLKNFGSIYCWFFNKEKFWDAEDHGTQYQPTENNSVFVAASFTEFVNALMPDKTIKKRPTEVDVSTMEHTVANFAKYGDQCLPEATAFFDKLSVDELNASWPKDATYPHPPIRTAINYRQVGIVKYLVSRGIDIDNIVFSASTVEISKVLVEAKGNTMEVKKNLLLSAASRITSTSKPEHFEQIISWLTASGVQPDFENSDEYKKWNLCIGQCGSKKVLRFYAQHINFPDTLNNLIEKMLSRRFDNALSEESLSLQD